MFFFFGRRIANSQSQSSVPVESTPCMRERILFEQLSWGLSYIILACASAIRKERKFNEIISQSRKSLCNLSCADDAVGRKLHFDERFDCLINSSSSNKEKQTWSNFVCTIKWEMQFVRRKLARETRSGGELCLGKWFVDYDISQAYDFELLLSGPSKTPAHRPGDILTNQTFPLTLLNHLLMALNWAIFSRNFHALCLSFVRRSERQKWKSRFHSPRWCRQSGSSSRLI